MDYLHSSFTDHSLHLWQSIMFPAFLFFILSICLCQSVIIIIMHASIFASTSCLLVSTEIMVVTKQLYCSSQYPRCCDILYLIHIYTVGHLEWLAQYGDLLGVEQLYSTLLLKGTSRTVGGRMADHCSVTPPTKLGY